jgi:4a-hydroxytetrahydrobiopterin dehydratase
LSIAEKLNSEQILQHLSELEGWEFDQSNTEIFKIFRFKGYYKTIAFVNFTAWHAQKANHHPDLKVSYGKVEVRLTTHDSDGITHKDFDLAKQLEDHHF